MRDLIELIILAGFGIVICAALTQVIWDLSKMNRPVQGSTCQIAGDELASRRRRWNGRA